MDRIDDDRSIPPSFIVRSLPSTSLSLVLFPPPPLPPCILTFHCHGFIIKGYQLNETTIIIFFFYHYSVKFPQTVFIIFISFVSLLFLVLFFHQIT